MEDNKSSTTEKDINIETKFTVTYKSLEEMKKAIDKTLKEKHLC